MNLHFQKQKIILSLPEANIEVFSQNLTFETGKPTSFKVDVVLSFRPEDQMEEGIQYLNEDGMIIAVEPFDIDKAHQSSPVPFKTWFVFKTINLDKLMKSPSIRKHLVGMINADLQRGVIEPLPLKTFLSDQIESAVRFMSTEKHNDKILVAMPNQNEISNMRVKPKFVANSKSVYIIVGGLGGLGLELANFIIMRGAKILILSSRRGPSSAYQHYRVR